MPLHQARVFPNEYARQVKFLDWCNQHLLPDGLKFIIPGASKSAESSKERNDARAAFHIAKQPYCAVMFEVSSMLCNFLLGHTMHTRFLIAGPAAVLVAFGDGQAG